MDQWTGDSGDPNDPNDPNEHETERDLEARPEASAAMNAAASGGAGGDAGDADEAGAAGAPGYEQPDEPTQPIGDEMAESAGGPFTGHAQPVGHPDVQEGDTSEANDAAADTGEASEASHEARHEAHADDSTPALRVEVDLAEGDLTILGAADAVTVNASEWSPEYSAHEFDGGVRFNRLPDGAELRTPDGALVIVREVEGDLRCERFDGELRVSRAQGDARIEDVAVARLNWVAGDLTADHIGALLAEGVAGDVWLGATQQPSTLGRVGGSLEARRVAGLTVTESVGGDVEIERCEFVTIPVSVGGDLELRRTPGAAHLGHIGGDATLDDVREVSLGSVGGDLDLRGVAGPATCGSVGGDAELANTFGAVSLGSIGGDLQVERAPGGVTASHVGGDATIDTLLRPEAKYLISAGSDITLRVRGEVNARFVAQSFGGEIRTRLPLTVEKGRRRNLVGALGSGSATVTLQSGGDISIVAADGQRGDYRMGDDYDNQGYQGNPGDQGGDQGDQGAHTFEGALGGGRKFRVRVENGPGRAGFQFKGPYTPEDEERAREFRLEWERGHGAHASGEYGEQLNDLREQAESLARRAGEEARKYAEMATRRARETDWESVGSEIRTTIERAMSDLEEAFTRVRRDWEPRGPGAGPSGPSGRPSNSGPQRVRIEHDDEPQAGATGGAYGAAEAGQPQDRDASRRQTLEDLRNGRITLDDAERRLNDLR